MAILDQLRARFVTALTGLAPDPLAAAEMLRPTQDAKFGDYQANCAMSLANASGQPPRKVAEAIVERLHIDDLCLSPQIAGPGFINLTLRDSYVSLQAGEMLCDDHLGVFPVESPRTVIVDFSGPNVAKPMHVGHIRSTVIGDAIANILRYRGHRVITDNHLGDWGTQFGMVIYGYKHFCDAESLTSNPVGELSRLYRYVNDLIGYHNSCRDLPNLEKAAQTARQAADQAELALKPNDKKAEKALRQMGRRAEEAEEQVENLRTSIATTNANSKLISDARAHPDVARAVLLETSKLHSGDAENVSLWRQFMPHCLHEIERVYQRLNISFDTQLGESFYHDQLPGVIEKLCESGLASESEGATCVFLDGFDAPMIVQKQDGAYLYATTDLATLQYRQAEYAPDAVLYVVDHRQSEHFEKLFAVASQWGMDEIILRHVSFGTVLGPDGKPFKTRSGSSVGLIGLLDDAVNEAMKAVCDPVRMARFDPPFTEEERHQIAWTVGHGAIKYFDLMHLRTSDYEFDLQKMVSLDGNTSAYVQYAYARIQSLLRAAGADEETIRNASTKLRVEALHERALVLLLLRFGEALDQSLQDYRPNGLVDYLYEVARAFSGFFENCPVVKATDDAVRESRLAISALTGCVLRQGLALLGIDVVPRM